MIYGYTGKMLFVDLSTGEMNEETPDESLYRDFIGGYGVGARILYSRMKGGVHPLGPENILPPRPARLPARRPLLPAGSLWWPNRRSPAGGGIQRRGAFRPYLKFAGYDGVFINGIAKKPVYLFIDNGESRIKRCRSSVGEGLLSRRRTVSGRTGSGSGKRQHRPARGKEAP